MEDHTNPNSPDNGEYVKCVCGVVMKHEIAFLDKELNWHCPTCAKDIAREYGWVPFWIIMIHGDKKLPQWWLMCGFVILVMFFIVVLIMLIV